MNRILVTISLGLTVSLLLITTAAYAVMGSHGMGPFSNSYGFSSQYGRSMPGMMGSMMGGKMAGHTVMGNGFMGNGTMGRGMLYDGAMGPGAMAQGSEDRNAMGFGMMGSGFMGNMTSPGYNMPMLGY